MAQYQPLCETCKIYPAALDKQVCWRCAEKEKGRREEQKTVERTKKGSVPYCGACLTTLRLRDVNAEGVGICIACKAKYRPSGSYRSLADSYGWWVTKAQDQNGIY